MLDNFCNKLQEHFKEQLVAVVLYGSAAKAGLQNVNTNLNILIITASLNVQQLGSLQQNLAKEIHQNRIIPIFWTLTELESALDVFPVEFSDIKNCYRILAGKDVVATLQLDNKNLRHQLEFELRGKLTHFRQAIALSYGSKDSVQNMLLAAATSLRHLLSRCHDFLGDRYNPEWSGVLDECLALKQSSPINDSSHLYGLSERLHQSICQIIEALNVE